MYEEFNQVFLNPTKLNNVDENWAPKSPLNHKVKKFGFYPNLDLMLPGDLILVSNLSPNYSHKAIEYFQKKLGYDDEDARWHHVALYIGNNDICESDLNGIECKSLERYSTGNHLIRIRRNKDLSIDKRWSIAMTAVRKSKERYNFFALLEIGLSALQSNFPPNVLYKSNPEKSAKICSQLCVDSYATITNYVIQDNKSPTPIPACLSYEHQYLQDVKVG